MINPKRNEWKKKKNKTEFRKRFRTPSFKLSKTSIQLKNCIVLPKLEQDLWAQTAPAVIIKRLKKKRRKKRKEEITAIIHAKLYQ